MGLQETFFSGDLKKVSRKVSLNWATDDYDFIKKDVLDNSKGLPCVWNSKVFQKVNQFTGDQFFGLLGLWCSCFEVVNIVNVYGPQGVEQKLEVWRQISKTMDKHTSIWVIFGNFNVVHYKEERFGSRFEEYMVIEFNNFIISASL